MPVEAPLRFVAHLEDLVDQVLAGHGGALVDATHLDDSVRPLLRTVSLPRSAATATYHAVARNRDAPGIRILLGTAADLARADPSSPRRLAG
ncbi:hypothetical protein [Nocardioides sp.]|uniref:hypothetical protein n=1 Tax=Nocardioides sp. TaxID=35761 RepID=UPI0025DEADEF|nr:hypothetical protein [Nocardioides sp.]